ncbi:MFS transporter [Sphingomonas sp. C8-2]|uniref:MFS transporter n=1 Tax=Rhizorhabdus histidinilytica TaxID=439228 RepID=UPI000F771065|nr:MFS transporter [Sphingomonas sp. C8-2]
MRRNDEFVLTALLSLNFGLVFLDRNALNYMMPFVAPDLKLATSQIGLLAGATALSWALSGMIFSSVSDRTGRRKRIVLIATIAFSLLSIASGFATGFLSLLLIRFALGAAEGPILPLSQAIVADEARPERRGLLMGLMNNFGSNLVGVMIAPPLLVAIAETAGWRAGFFVAGLPGLIMAVLILLLVREPERRAAIEIDAGAPRDWGALLRSRNLLLCMLISCCMLAWTILGWAFLPVQFVQGNGFAPGAMGGLMAVLGASAVVSSILVPGLSDRIGRKPAIVLFASLGVVPPLATTFSGLDPWALAPLLFLGWTASGTLPLFMATIPAESTSPGQLATAMALVMGVGEVIGGAVMPVVAGFAGDGHGLVAVMMIQAACAVLAALIALFLIETAPFRRHRPAAA